MPHFPKRISTDFGHSEFIFDRLFTGGGARYHIAVLDKGRAACIFSMEASGDKWHIINDPKISEWILTLENELTQAIIGRNSIHLK
jgi:hypothetical protein